MDFTDAKDYRHKKKAFAIEQKCRVIIPISIPNIFIQL